MTYSEREALNLARLELPDCFVVHQSLMEGGDGLRLVSALRARPETRQSAVILVVENGDVQTAAKGLDLGASDYIEAPFDVSELIARIRSQLRRKRYSDRLRSNVRNGLKLAVIDPLTGIYNRRYASQHMNRVMERARETDGVFAVMMIDLDKFKSINDRFGHDAGDAVLREFSRRLQENIRGVDLVARFGGEEFFVAMPDVDQHAAAAAAERIRRAVEGAPVMLPGGAGQVHVTVSIGVAIASRRGRRRRGDHQAGRQRALQFQGGRAQPRQLLRPGGLILTGAAAAGGGRGHAAAPRRRPRARPVTSGRSVPRCSRRPTRRQFAGELALAFQHRLDRVQVEGLGGERRGERRPLAAQRLAGAGPVVTAVVRALGRGRGGRGRVATGRSARVRAPVPAAVPAGSRR